MASFRVSALVTGALRQRLTCSARPSAVHEKAVRGALRALGLSIGCRDAKVRATLAGSITARSELVRHKSATGKVLTSRRLVWLGGFVLREPARRLALTLWPRAAGVNRNLVLTTTTSTTMFVKNRRRTYRLVVRIAPVYAPLSASS